MKNKGEREMQSEYHECKTINEYDEISIEKIDGSWIWIFWNDKKGNRGYGIRYCPYCGKELIANDKK